MVLIAREGYSGTTLDAIGAEAGYSRQLVTQRFGSKDRLLHEVIARHGETLRHHYEARRSGLVGLPALYSEIDNYLHTPDVPVWQSRAFFVLMLDSIGPARQFRPAFAAISARWEDSLSEPIATAQRQGTLRPDVQPRLEAAMLIAALRGIRIRALLDDEGMDLAVQANALKVALAERLLPRALGDVRNSG